MFLATLLRPDFTFDDDDDDDDDEEEEEKEVFALCSRAQCLSFLLQMKKMGWERT